MPRVGAAQPCFAALKAHFVKKIILAFVNQLLLCARDGDIIQVDFLIEFLERDLADSPLPKELLVLLVEIAKVVLDCYAVKLEPLRRVRCQKRRALLVLVELLCLAIQMHDVLAILIEHENRVFQLGLVRVLGVLLHLIEILEFLEILQMRRGDVRPVALL